jgi:hypothetical protein
LAETAVAHRAPWLRSLGEPLIDSQLRDQKKGEVRVVVAYRDRYAIESRSAVGSDAVSEVGDGAGEVRAGYGYGLLAHVDRDWNRARSHYAVAVDGFINLGTPVWEGVALAGLGRCDEADGDTPATEARYSEALELGRRLGEPAVTACALEGLARLALAAGDRTTATEDRGAPGHRDALR